MIPKRVAPWRRPALLLVLLLVACTPAAPAPFPLHITVSTGSGAPVSAAAILVNDTNAGSTNATGELRMVSSAAEGSVLTLRVVCPSGYESASEPTSVALRRLATLDGSNTPAALRQRLICNATEQTSVVVVSTGEPNLPILVNGTAQATTNAAGIAHVALRGKPNTPFELKLDATTRPELHPQNPTRSFTLGRTGELFSFVQQIKAEKPRIRRVSKKPERSVPYRID